MVSRTTTHFQADERQETPSIKRISLTDVQTALSKGLDDFKEKPSHVVFLCIVYPVVALILSRFVFGYDILPLLFPLIAGFALVGPVAAIGLYELSRRREGGLELSWRHAADVVKSPAIKSVVTLGMVLVAIFFAWLLTAMGIYAATLGALPSSVSAFLDQLFFTPEGWTLIVVGNAVGLVFAIAVLAISVVSFPMLIDRHVSAGTAVRTSINAVMQNPKPMAFWGLVVAGGLILGSIPFFIGLAVTFPILGHATWHLYRAAVER